MVQIPKGYVTPFGYKGLVNGRYILFAIESEYLEYIAEQETEPNS
jgi:hypothetical protein